MNVKLSVSVPLELAKFCEDQVEKGRFKNRSQAISHAIKELKEREEEKES